MALVSRIAIFSALILAAALNAQTPTGNIEGVITDPSGALVEGGAVSVIESATGRTIRLATDDQGRYAVHGLLPGAYDVLVQATGFAARRVTGVTVNAGSVVTVSVALEFSALGQTITTTADPVLIDASRHTLDSVITGAEIDSLPLFERNFLDPGRNCAGRPGAQRRLDRPHQGAGLPQRLGRRPLRQDHARADGRHRCDRRNGGLHGRQLLAAFRQ